MLSAFLAPIPPRVISRGNRGSYGNRARRYRAINGIGHVRWIAAAYFLRGWIPLKNKQLELGGPSLSWHHSQSPPGWFPFDSRRSRLSRREDLRKGRRRSLGSNMRRPCMACTCVYTCVRVARCVATSACINACTSARGTIGGVVVCVFPLRRLR